MQYSKIIKYEYYLVVLLVWKLHILILKQWRIIKNSKKILTNMYEERKEKIDAMSSALIETSAIK